MWEAEALHRMAVVFVTRLQAGQPHPGPMCAPSSLPPSCAVAAAARARRRSAKPAAAARSSAAGWRSGDEVGRATGRGARQRTGREQEPHGERGTARVSGGCGSVLYSSRQQQHITAPHPRRAPDPAGAPRSAVGSGGGRRRARPPAQRRRGTAGSHKGALDRLPTHIEPRTAGALIRSHSRLGHHSEHTLSINQHNTRHPHLGPQRRRREGGASGQRGGG